MKHIYLTLLHLLIGIMLVHAQTLDWAIGIHSGIGDYGQQITTDKAGNVYTIGTFMYTVDFDPGPDSSFITSQGGSDIFIQKLDSSGNMLWTKAIGGMGYEFPGNIAVDDSGNVYTTGGFEDTVDFDPNTGTAYLHSNGSVDMFVQKLDANGNLLWAKRAGGAIFDYGNAIMTDDEGNVFIAGNYYDKVDFDPGPDSSFLISQGGDDIFLQKLDAGGNLIWAKTMGGKVTDYPSSLTLDDSGYVYMTGWFIGMADFDPGPDTFYLATSDPGSPFRSAFIQKLDKEGKLIWVKNLEGRYTDSRDIAVSASGKVYTVGSFYGKADFDPGPDSTFLSSNGYSDVFVLKLDKKGNFKWAKGIGGNGSDHGYSISVTNVDEVYITGSFKDTADFDPNEGELLSISNGGSDIFIQKLDSAGKLSWLTTMGGGKNDVGRSITLDEHKQIYTAGVFREIVDFDPSPGIFNLTSRRYFSGTGFFEAIFIQKLNPANGTPIETFLPQAISLYPNPSNGLCYVKLPQGLGEAHIQLINAVGKIAYSGELTGSNSPLVLSGLPSGMYHVKITADKGKVYYGKLLLVK